MTTDRTPDPLRFLILWIPRMLPLLLALAIATVARGQSGETSEYEIKAAFLYNFARYVKWPEKAPSASNNIFVIGIIGTDPFGEILDRTMQGKTIHGKPIVVQRHTRPETATSSDILFVGALETSNLSRLLAIVDKAPILTVGEMPTFAQRGGMINLVTSENRVHFEVNVEAAERARLTLSSQLLRLARIVPDARAER